MHYCGNYIIIGIVVVFLSRLLAKSILLHNSPSTFSPLYHMNVTQKGISTNMTQSASSNLETNQPLTIRIAATTMVI